MQNDDLWERHLTHYREADALYRKGQIKKARTLFLSALALAPNDADTLWALGSCWSELGNPRVAQRYFRRARTRADWKDRGDLLYNMANALLDQGRPTAALAFYKRVPRSAQAYLLAKRNVLLARRLMRLRAATGTRCEWSSANDWA
jgi:tetratricopeptide (TPR) repeat protein